MDDLDLHLEAFESRLRAGLRREIIAIATVPLAVGLLAGILLGRHTAPPPRAVAVPSICEAAVAKHGGAFALDVDDSGVRMKLQGFGD